MISRRALIAALLLLASPAGAVEATVSAAPVTRFRGAEIDQPVEGLIFRGGLTLQSPDDTFGGLSSVTQTGPDQRIAFITDRGNFVAGQLAYDEADRLIGVIGVSIEPMENSGGAVLPRQYARDAEGMDTIWRNGEAVAVRVGFEHLTRVADFSISDGKPGGAAREIAIPQWLSDERTNETLESVCIAPPASPIAGSTLLLTEEALDADGNHRGELLGVNDKGPIGYTNSPIVNPTDCKFLPNGDLLVLERGVSLFTFVMNLRLVPAAEVRPGNLMSGELLLTAQGGEIDNMESLMVHQTPAGETRILIGSDNNFNDWQRTLLLEFALPQ
ncbi:esterase-like activity of phytase family protein [Devosia sp. XJ19-1]|uniref:Esterase-like activity of phytase family protein n=1 Tax=Devosia ureilytica TaxID=2952754 RepID=A0A9Q4ASJ7_9HYPH|nr:esterase-like activity of phytase family protein [Devosia ureilytica]MCP8885368.1 esterase-like activity of phytase family protein [Devosia ureilytica]MCP8888956.1 esterase-like activity of phytase family protein [Devosia ureilytica]